VLTTLPSATASECPTNDSVGGSYADLAWKPQNARKRLHTVTCYHPSRIGGATQIGSKRTFPIKLIDGFTSSRVQTIFAVHAR
jgi:hypothetical protein